MAITIKPTKKVKKPRPSLETSLAIIKGSGTEPIINKDAYRESLMRALNWYNSNWDEKDYRKSAEHYVARVIKSKEGLAAINKASFLEVRVIGFVGRLLVREQYLDLNEVEKALVQLEALKVKYSKKVVKVLSPVEPTQAKAKPVAAPPMGIQERINENAHNLAGDVEGAIDDFLKSGTEFSMKSFLAGNQVSGVVAKRISSFFEPRIKEIELAYSGKDAQLKEGYSHLPKRKLKQYIEFLQQIVADCNQQVVSAKAQRKPRATKVKPPSVIVKALAYKKEDAELKLKSVPAEKIVGATELWAYNTVTRKMTVFYAADGGYLTVNRMSIANYDVTKSETKTLRKPADFFKGLTTTGKRAMANAWKALTAKPSEPKARLNMDVILFAVN